MTLLEFVRVVNDRQPMPPQAVLDYNEFRMQSELGDVARLLAERSRGRPIDREALCRELGHVLHYGALLFKFVPGDLWESCWTVARQTHPELVTVSPLISTAGNFDAPTRVRLRSLLMLIHRLGFDVTDIIESCRRDQQRMTLNDVA